MEPETIAGLGLLGVALFWLRSKFRAKPAHAAGPGNAATPPVPGRKPISANRTLTEYEVLQLASSMWQYGLNIHPYDLVSTAFIESSYRPYAERYEVRLNDSSIGLMQVLTTTALDLYSKGYAHMGRPSAAALRDPLTSMYFGAAYFDWLKKSYRGRPLEWYVRAYNGGPGHSYSAATAHYWAKWQAKRESFRAVEVYS